MPENRPSRYRWLILGLSAATGTFVAAIPFNCMPVLFPEIAADLNLSVVQIGFVWGIASLSGVFVSLLSGVLGDRFGVHRVLTISCLLIGVTGALRGVSNSFTVLMVTMFVYGIVRAMLPVNITRTVGLWFKGRNLGMANGTSAMGMGLGLMLGPMISATLLSPALGGWRNVLFLYGGISVFVGVIWAVFGGRKPQSAESGGESEAPPLPFKQAFSKVIRIKSLWLLAFTLMFRVGSIIGFTGYLPTYLQENRGWETASSDNTLAAFFAISTLMVVPLATLSDRIGSRKAILYPAIIMQTIALSLIPVVDGALIWLLVILSGIFMDAFMSMLVTTLLETEGVGMVYSGTALGAVFTLAQLGGVISPPAGNAFASISPGLPFTVWAGFSVLALVTLFFVKDTGRRRRSD